MVVLIAVFSGITQTMTSITYVNTNTFDVWIILTLAVFLTKMWELFTNHSIDVCFSMVAVTTPQRGG